jgi:hypothetical protein
MEKRSFFLVALFTVLLVAGCREKTADNDDALRTAIGEDTEYWYGVYMQGVKVGHSMTRTRVVEERGERLVETVTSSTIESQKGRDTVRLQVSATSLETLDGDLRRFSRSIDTGAGPQIASGHVADGQLTIEDLAGGNRSLKWLSECRGFHAWQKMLAASPPPDGEVRGFRALDDSFLIIAPQELAGGKWEETSTPAGAKKLRRMEHRLTMPDGQRRATQLWIDERGTCVKLRDDTMDIEFHLMPRDAALKPATEKLNLLYDTMVRLEGPLANARRTRWVRYRVSVARGEAEKMFAASPAQAVRRVDADIVELIVRAVTPSTTLSEAVAGIAFPEETRQPDAAHLKANHYISADDPRVAAMASEAAPAERDPFRLAVALEAHVHGAIKEFAYSQAFLTAAEVARGGKGDCSEHAVLLAALLRARGMASRVVVGLVYVDREAAMGYHMWTEAWIDDRSAGGRWVGFDATLGEGGVAADHIQVATTNLERGLADPALVSLGQLLGAKPRIEVAEAHYRER